MIEQFLRSVRKRGDAIQSDQGHAWRREWAPVYFWSALFGISFVVTAARYWSPMDLYPYAPDDAYYFVHSTREWLASSVFGARGPRPLSYLIVALLQPRGASPGLLPEAFHFWGLSYTSQIQYAIFQMAAIVVWLVPLAGFVVWKITNSRLAGVLVALLMAASPYQNLIAPTLEPQVIQIFPVIGLCYRIWCVDQEQIGRQYRFRAGLWTGFIATLGVMISYHVWFLLVVLFPLVGLYMAFGDAAAGRPLLDNIAARALKVLPYAVGVTIGLFGPLSVLDLIFRLNEATNGMLFQIRPGTYSYFDAAFALSVTFPTGAFSLSNWAGGMGRFADVIRHQIGYWGTWLLIGAIVWQIYRAWRARRPTPGALMAAVLVGGFLVISLPTFGGFGRLTMPFEFLAYLLVVTAIIDVTSIRSRAVIRSIPVLSLFLLMVMHMVFSSAVVLDQLRGHGRAAAWLQANPADIYYADSPWAPSPKLSVEEARKLNLPSKTYLIAIIETPQDWQKILKDVHPVRQWRNAYGAWRSFHAGGNYDYFWDHFVVYDLQQVIDRLRNDERRPIAGPR